MGKTIIYNGVIVCDGTTKINNGYVLFDENGILDIGSNYSQLIKANDIDKHDAMGNWVTPGFIDIHNHGGYGYDYGYGCGCAPSQLLYIRSLYTYYYFLLVFQKSSPFPFKTI